MSSRLHLIALRLRRTWHVMAAISVFATALGALWWEYDVLGIHDSDRGAYDDGLKKFVGQAWFPWGAARPSTDIVLVALDDKTSADISAFPYWRDRYGRWPYDRRLYADLVTYLHSIGVRAVVMDQTMEEASGDEAGDFALGEALRRTRLPFYLGFNFVAESSAPPKVAAFNHPPGPPEPPDAGSSVGAAPTDEPAKPSTSEEEFPEDPAPEASTEASAAGADATAAVRLELMARRYAFPVEARGGLAIRQVDSVTGRFFLPDGGDEVGARPQWPVAAIDPVLDAVTGWGSVQHEPDEDGKMRRTSFAYTDGVNTYVTLPVAVAADLLGADKVVLEPGVLTLGSRRIRIDRDGAAWINYGGTLAQRFPSRPLSDVLRSMSNHRLDNVLRDKIVIIGGFALGMGDSKATPLEQAVPGVIKQAAALDNLLHDSFITDAPYALSLLLTFVVCLFSTALVLIVRNAFIDIGWPIALYLGFFLVTGSFLTLTQVHVLNALPSLAGTLASILATTWERIFADKQREQLKEMFRAYMESDLVELMVEQNELPKLDGEVRRITAYFSDIKGFSSFSELYRDDPKGLMRLLNRYLSTVTPVLTQEGACIDKYIGDAVVALFGAPVRHDDHALRACRSALGVQNVLAELRAVLAAEGLPDVYTRIGINTDELLVGNIGSQQLLDYTAIGDGMNLASRLEGANKAYGTLILMGEQTYLEVKEHVVAREVDRVRVAGKHLAVRVYELVGLRGEVPAARMRVLELYAETLLKYRAQDFVSALATLEEIRSIDGEDGPSQTLRARCEAFLVSAPPPDWDGVSDLEK